jgi:hypothetical protein
MEQGEFIDITCWNENNLFCLDIAFRFDFLYILSESFPLICIIPWRLTR